MNKTVKSIFANAERKIDTRINKCFRDIEELKEAKRKLQGMKGVGKKK